MTPDKKDKWIALIEGVAAGGQLQVKYGEENWCDADGVRLSADTTHYRIKPREPRSIEGFVFKEAFTQNVENSTFMPIRALDGCIRVRITEILE